MRPGLELYHFPLAIADRTAVVRKVSGKFIDERT